MCLSGWSTTAAATTGPARQPRPTSSTPPTYTNPTRRNAFSSVRIAETRIDLRLHGVLHPCGLALQVAQVVQLRATDLGRPHHLDLLDRRRVQREDPLDALAERHLAHGERRARAAAMLPDDEPFKDLNPLLVTLAHLHVHTNGVARPHRRPIGQL